MTWMNLHSLFGFPLWTGTVLKYLTSTCLLILSGHNYFWSWLTWRREGNGWQRKDTLQPSFALKTIFHFTFWAIWNSGKSWAYLSYHPFSFPFLINKYWLPLLLLSNFFPKAYPIYCLEFRMCTGLGKSSLIRVFLYQ